MQNFIVSFIGDDRPGIVRDIADLVSREGGNWVESRMIQLDDKFAGLVRVSVADEASDRLINQLRALQADAFSLIIEATSATDAEPKNLYCLDIVGTDRPGIVHETTSALAQQDVNVVEISSEVSPAAMSGTAMFNCTATVAVGADTNIEALDGRLSEIAQTLAIDIQIEPHST